MRKQPFLYILPLLIFLFGINSSVEARSRTQVRKSLINLTKYEGARSIGDVFIWFPKGSTPLFEVDLELEENQVVIEELKRRGVLYDPLAGKIVLIKDGYVFHPVQGKEAIKIGNPVTLYGFLNDELESVTPTFPLLGHLPPVLSDPKLLPDFPGNGQFPPRTGLSIEIPKITRTPITTTTMTTTTVNVLLTPFGTPTEGTFDPIPSSPYSGAEDLADIFAGRISVRDEQGNVVPGSEVFAIQIVSETGGGSEAVVVTDFTSSAIMAVLLASPILTDINDNTDTLIYADMVTEILGGFPGITFTPTVNGKVPSTSTTTVSTTTTTTKETRELISRYISIFMQDGNTTVQFNTD